MESEVKPKPQLRSALSTMGKRFRLLWSQSTIEAALKDLKSATQDFDVLSNQVIKLISEIHQSSADPASLESVDIRTKAITLNSLEAFGSIRLASTGLYSAISQYWTCAGHQSHNVHISFASYDAETRPSPVSFKVAVLACGDVSGKMPLWLQVESHNEKEVEAFHEVDSSDAIIRQLEDIASALSLKSSLTKTIARAPRAESKPSTQRVRVCDGPIEKQIPDINRQSHLSGQRISMTNNRDLNHIRDYCQYFQGHHAANSAAKECLGYLKDPFLQQFFVLSPDGCINENPLSLEDVISDTVMTTAVSRYSLAQLATSLATIVLQFQSTPWLSSSWRSRDIKFFAPCHQTPNLVGSPYLAVEIMQPSKGKGIAVKCGDNLSTICDDYLVARNELLFRLGIILLELGLSKTWRELQLQAFQVLSPGNKTEYKAANYLARSPLMMRMGPKYAQIVRKCIGCDFGLGENDLANLALQRVFFRDVVVGLRSLEESIAKMHRKGII